MENKDIIIVGAILLGVVLIAGVFVLMGGNNNEVSKVNENSEKEFNEIKEKAKVYEKPEIKEVKNNKTGVTEKVVENGKILEFKYNGGTPQYNAVDAKLSKDIDAITISLDYDAKMHKKYDLKGSLLVLMTTPHYFNKTHNFLIYFASRMDQLSYDDYLKLIEDAKKELRNKYENICDKYKNDKVVYEACLNQTKLYIDLYDKLLKPVDEDTYNKFVEMSKQPIKIIYVYRNGTEEIYLSKNLYAQIDATIYALYNVTKETLKINLKNTTSPLDISNEIAKEFMNNFAKYNEIAYKVSYNFYTKINKPYVLIKRNVINKNLADKLFGNMMVINSDKTVKEMFDEFMKNITENKDKIFKALENASITLNSLDFVISVQKDFNINEYIPKESDCVNYEDLKLINIYQYIDDLAKEFENFLKRNYKKLNMSEYELNATLQQIESSVAMVKMYVKSLKEQSFIDLLSSFMMFTSYSPYYKPYNQVNPPNYHYVSPNYEYNGGYETEIKPISA